MRCLILFAISISTAFSADFTTYIGPPTQNPDLATASAIAVDAHGNTYVTGNNAIVTKLDPAGNVVFATALGPGNIYTYGSAIAVDPSGNVWVAGQTNAANFPLVKAIQSSGVGSGSGFVAKIAPYFVVVLALDRQSLRPPPCLARFLLAMPSTPNGVHRS